MSRDTATMKGSLLNAKPWRFVVRLMLAASFIVAGISHFARTASFTAIVPPCLPWPVALVYVSGAAEIILGILLTIPWSAGLAGWGLIALLVAVFPANLNMALHSDAYAGIPAAILWLRLPVQGVLIAVVSWSSRPLMGRGRARQSPQLTRRPQR